MIVCQQRSMTTYTSLQCSDFQFFSRSFILFFYSFYFVQLSLLLFTYLQEVKKSQVPRGKRVNERNLTYRDEGKRERATSCCEGDEEGEETASVKSLPSPSCRRYSHVQQLAINLVFFSLIYFFCFQTTYYFLIYPLCNQLTVK